MACTTKSSPPHFSRSAANTAIDARNVLDIAGQYGIGTERLRQRLDTFAERLALIGEGELGALRGSVLAMPQAIE